jgi:hypothetical protein
MPVDPMLAAAFSGCGKLVLGSGALEVPLLLRCDDKLNGLLLENQEWQGLFPHEFWPDHFRALMFFGRQMLYGYATVPGLLSPEGTQPVVRVDPYEEIHALPVASNVDRFFDTYSRYVELLAEDPGYLAGEAAWVRFPFSVPELIARDRPLVEMIKQGRFDPLMYERNKTGWRSEEDIAQTREWVSKLLGS